MRRPGPEGGQPREFRRRPVTISAKYSLDWYMRIFDATLNGGGYAMIASQARVDRLRGEAILHRDRAGFAEAVGGRDLALAERQEALRLMCLAAGLSEAQPDRSLLHLEAIGLAADLGDLERVAELIEAAGHERAPRRFAAWLGQLRREIGMGGREGGQHRPDSDTLGLHRGHHP